MQQVFFIATSGICVNLDKEKSKKITDDIDNYITSFKDDDFEISAHRGFSSLEVENSKEAIVLAAEQDYIDYIEVDARLTKDGRIVLSHNDTILFDSSKITKISSLNYKEIIETDLVYKPDILHIETTNISEEFFLLKRTIKLNNTKYRLISLLEGLDLADNKKVLLDLKFNLNIIQFACELKEELKNIDTSNIIFQSSNIPGILYIQNNTDFNCLAIIKKRKDLKYLPRFDNIGLRKNLINYDMIKKLLQENKKVAVWTINNSNELDRVVSELDDLYKNVIYITDYPDLIATKLHNKEKIKKAN